MELLKIYQQRINDLERTKSPAANTVYNSLLGH